MVHVLHETSAEAPVFTTGKEVEKEFEELGVKGDEKVSSCTEIDTRAPRALLEVDRGSCYHEREKTSDVSQCKM